MPGYKARSPSAIDVSFMGYDLCMTVISGHISFVSFREGTLRLCVVPYGRSLLFFKYVAIHWLHCWASTAILIAGFTF